MQAVDYRGDEGSEDTDKRQRFMRQRPIDERERAEQDNA